MAFPASTSAAGTVHFDNNEGYVLRNSRWEKLQQPRVVTGGDQGDVIDGGLRATGSWFYNSWGAVQRGSFEGVRIMLAFRTAANSHASIGFWSTSVNDWLPKAHYSESDGQVRWAGGGNGWSYPDWKFSNTPSTSLFLGSPASDRLCKALMPQFADINLMALDESHTLLCWKFYSNINSSNYVVWNTARSVIDKPITDLTGCVAVLDTGVNFSHARMDAEVY